MIISNPETGTWENIGAIRQRFVQLESVNGSLGFPTGPHNCPQYTAYCVQAFENGVIVSNSATGTWENMQPVREKFIELNSVRGPLGFPTGPHTIIEEDRIYQRYQHGIITYRFDDETTIVEYDL